MELKTRALSLEPLNVISNLLFLKILIENFLFLLALKANSKGFLLENLEMNTKYDVKVDYITSYGTKGTSNLNSYLLGKCSQSSLIYLNIPLFDY